MAEQDTSRTTTQLHYLEPPFSMAHAEKKDKIPYICRNLLVFVEFRSHEDRPGYLRTLSRCKKRLPVLDNELLLSIPTVEKNQDHEFIFNGTLNVTNFIRCCVRFDIQ